MNTHTIYIDSDPSTLGDSSSDQDVDRYSDNLASLLGREFSCEIDVQRQPGGFMHRCLTDLAINDRIYDIETGDEWIALVSAAA